MLTRLTLLDPKIRKIYPVLALQTLKVPVLRLSTYDLLCARIAAQYYEITPPLELDQN